MTLSWEPSIIDKYHRNMPMFSFIDVSPQLFRCSKHYYHFYMLKAPDQVALRLTVRPLATQGWTQNWTMNGTRNI